MALGSLVADGKGLERCQIFEAVFFFQLKVGTMGWITWHELRVSCHHRYLKMLVSNATAGILIGKGGMALKDSVFCLAVFLFKVDLNNRSTTPLPLCISRKMGTRMVH